MNTRAFSLSLILAGLAAYMVYTYLEGERNRIISRFGKEKAVVVAKVDIKEMELLDDTKVTIIKVPEAFLANGHLKDIKEVYNTIATVPILKGEQVTVSRITYPGVKTGLARLVSNSKRAFSINVDNTSAVSRLIKPGDRVDILAFLNYAGGKIEWQKVITVLQDVLVLATGPYMTNALPMIEIKSNTDAPGKKVDLSTFREYTAVTLELDPYQVQKMLFIAAGQKYYLSLRNNNDKKIIRIKPTRLYDVLGDDAAEAKKYFSNQK